MVKRLERRPVLRQHSPSSLREVVPASALAGHPARLTQAETAMITDRLNYTLSGVSVAALVAAPLADGTSGAVLCVKLRL